MKYSLFLFALIAIVSCKKYEPQLGDPPTEADTEFSAIPSSATPNVLELASANQAVLCRWDFGNGTTAEGTEVTAEYPYAGTYTIKLTVFTKGGSKSATKEVTIVNDDLSLLSNPIFGLLTGGLSGPGYKVWYIDSTASGNMGVGPDPESALGPIPEYWSAGPNEKPNCGLYNTRYTFTLSGFGFDMVTNGDVYVHNSLSANFPGSFENLNDYTAPYGDKLGESWLLTEGGDENTITISNNAFIGFYTGVNTYRILELTDSTMSLQYADHQGGLFWYAKLKSI
ncbi:MAG: PKD domain-containing protein [Crocinitomicaceae bacterium]